MKLAPFIATILLAASVAVAQEQYQDVHLELRTESDTYQPGDELNVELWVTWVGELEPIITALDINLAWDPEALELLGASHEGTPETLWEGFIPGDCLSEVNESDPPADGDGYYLIWYPLGVHPYVPPEGLLVVTFQFEVLDALGNTTVDLFGLPEPWVFPCPAHGEGATWEIELAVWWGDIPAFNLLQGWTPAVIEIVPVSGPTDDEIVAAVIVLFVRSGCRTLINDVDEILRWVQTYRHLFREGDNP